MIALLLVLLLAAAPAFAQAVDASSVGRAGVHDLRLKCSGVLGWNPAALSPDRGYDLSFELPSFTGTLGNNAFNVDYWNDHVAGDRYLTDADKEAILDQIPGDKLEVNGEVNVPLVGFTYNRFGGRFAVESYNHAALPKDLARLALYGNELYRRYGIGEFEMQSQTIMDAAIGFGYRFDQEVISDLHFGAGFHYYQGLYLAELAESGGQLEVTDSLINGWSVLHTVESNRGDGVGFDLGALAALNERWEVGLALRQLGARVAWTVDDNQLVSFYTDSAGVITDSLNDEDYLERALHYTDTTYSGGTYETTLPIIVQANALFRATSKWTLTGDVILRGESGARGPAGLQVAAAGEFLATKSLPLYGGVSIGGPFGWQVGLGLGVRTSHYQLDIGGSWNGGLFNSARGLGLGISNRLMF
ncbi:MAG: DUF5723 family protein [bacterium]|nr:DUF5723 family protein [bacterium]